MDTRESGKINPKKRSIKRSTRLDQTQCPDDKTNKYQGILILVNFGSDLEAIF